MAGLAHLHICTPPLTAVRNQNIWRRYNAHTSEWTAIRVVENKPGNTGSTQPKTCSSRLDMVRAALNWPHNKEVGWILCKMFAWGGHKFTNMDKNVAFLYPAATLQGTTKFKVSKITPTNPYSVPSNVSFWGLIYSTGVELKCRNNLCNIPKAAPSGLAAKQRAYTKIPTPLLREREGVRVSL